MWHSMHPRPGQANTSSLTKSSCHLILSEQPCTAIYVWSTAGFAPPGFPKTSQRVICKLYCLKQVGSVRRRAGDLERNIPRFPGWSQLSEENAALSLVSPCLPWARPEPAPPSDAPKKLPSSLLFTTCPQGPLLSTMHSQGPPPSTVCFQGSSTVHHALPRPPAVHRDITVLLSSLFMLPLDLGDVSSPLPFLSMTSLLSPLCLASHA